MEGLVSIGMPVFNDKKYLVRAIESLLNQSYQNFELIISDDCSSDGSDVICQEYASKDKRIRYYRQKINIGISKNMEFLLRQANGHYFLWAANDDMWHKDFILLLMNELKKNDEAICAFCSYVQIDEDDKVITQPIVENYTGSSRFERLAKLVKKKSDGFGYGLFVTDAIRKVRFPVWWWINKKCAYSNIYPSLCFYLSKGEYSFLEDEILWFNRVKKTENVHHKIPFSNNFFLGFFAFALRKFNLVVFSLREVMRGSHSILLVVQIMPRMFYSWFFIPVFLNPMGKYKNFKKDKSVFI